MSSSFDTAIAIGNNKAQTAIFPGPTAASPVASMKNIIGSNFLFPLLKYAVFLAKISKVLFVLAILNNKVIPANIKNNELGHPASSVLAPAALDESAIKDKFVINNEEIAIAELKPHFTDTFDYLYEKPFVEEKISDIEFISENKIFAETSKKEPNVLIPIFRGTVGEYDLKQAFEKEGAKVDTFIFNFRTKEEYNSSAAKFAQKLKEYDILAFASGATMGFEVEQKGVLYDVLFNTTEIKEAVNEFVKDKSKLIIGLGEGFAGLVKSGLIEFGEVKEGTSIKILPNEREKFISSITDIKVVSNKSAFMNENSVGDVYQSPIASKNARVYLNEETFEKLAKNGQVTTVFAKENITNSKYGIESLTSLDGRIFGCVCAIDRIEEDLFKNVPIHNLPAIIKSAVKFFG